MGLNNCEAPNVKESRRQIIMKMFLVLTCCFALVSFAGAAQEEQGNAPPKKKSAHAEQTSQRPTGGPGYSRGAGPGHAVGPGQAVGTGRTIGAGQGHALGAGPKLQTQHGVATAPGRIKGPRDQNVDFAKVQTGAQAFHAQHYNLSSKTRPPTSVAPAVTYRAGSRIQGSQTWQGSGYTAFRNYTPQWHDRNWWGSRYNRIVFVFGAPYFWDSGYWYPAWGYDSNAYYAYDGPIYAYNDLPPDQVIANVQAALQAQGYYDGEVDGVLGPLTRAAIANYQRDQGLYITSAIDEPTLASLGMA
jgi:hypothetical protein